MRNSRGRWHRYAYFRSTEARLLALDHVEHRLPRERAEAYKQSRLDQRELPREKGEAIQHFLPAWHAIRRFSRMAAREAFRHSGLVDHIVEVRQPALGKK